MIGLFVWQKNGGSMLVFEDRFTNKSFFKMFSDVTIVVIIVIDVAALILALTVLTSIWREVFLVSALLMIVVFLPLINLMKRLSINRKITFKTDGKCINVLMGKSRVAKLNIPVSIQKGTGLETYFTNGSMTVRRLFVTDGEETLVIGEEINSSTMENFDSKPQPSELFAQNPGTLGRLETALSKYLKANQIIDQSSSIYENPIP